MDISDFLRIKKNVDQIIEIELSGNPKKQIEEYIDLLESEIIKKDIQDEIPEVELNFDENIPSQYYIGNQYTRKDLENECKSFFERSGNEIYLDELDPNEYHENMKKAYNRIIQRKHKRSKQLNN